MKSSFSVGACDYLSALQLRRLEPVAHSVAVHILTQRAVLVARLIGNEEVVLRFANLVFARRSGTAVAQITRVAAARPGLL